MGARTASPSPDSAGYNDGCPVHNKITVASVGRPASAASGVAGRD